MKTQREALLQELFDHMDSVKRGLAEHLRSLTYDCPISRSQIELLFAIRHTQPVSFKRLAQQLYLTPGAISQLAEGLEEQNLVSRSATEHDRRIQCLSVTKKGNRLLETMEKRRQQFLSTIMADLSDEELAVWLRVQHKMIEHFQKLNITEQTKKETV